MFPETEEFMTAIQDQVVVTKNYRKAVIKKEGIEDKCRRCESSGETIQHICCAQLAPEEYRKGHDDV